MAAVHIFSMSSKKRRNKKTFPQILYTFDLMFAFYAAFFLTIQRQSERQSYGVCVSVCVSVMQSHIS